MFSAPLKASATHRALADATARLRNVNTDNRPPYRRPARLRGTHVFDGQLVSRTSQDASTSGSWRPSTAGGEPHCFRPVLPFASDLFQQPRRCHGTAACAVRVRSCAGGRHPRRQIPGRAWCRLELRAQSRSDHRPRHNRPFSPCATPHLSGPCDARHGRSARLRQLAGSLYYAVGDRPDLGLARPRGGETAQSYIWRTLRGLSTANQYDHPSPSLDLPTTCRLTVRWRASSKSCDLGCLGTPYILPRPSESSAQLGASRGM